jgi:hypothetical protein
MPVGHSGRIALRREQCDMMAESWNSSLLGNGLVNTFPQKRIRETIEEQCSLWSTLRALLHNGMVNTSLQQ